MNLSVRFLTAAAAALLLTAGSALAQGVSSSEVNEAELESFAMALEDAVAIQGEMQAELDGASEAEAQEIRASFNQEMAAAIESHEIAVPRFNAIIGSLEQDAELNQRVAAKRVELAEMEQGG